MNMSAVFLKFFSLTIDVATMMDNCTSDLPVQKIEKGLVTEKKNSACY